MTRRKGQCVCRVEYSLLSNPSDLHARVGEWNNMLDRSRLGSLQIKSLCLMMKTSTGILICNDWLFRVIAHLIIALKTDDLTPECISTLGGTFWPIVKRVCEWNSLHYYGFYFAGLTTTVAPVIQMLWTQKWLRNANVKDVSLPYDFNYRIVSRKVVILLLFVIMLVKHRGCVLMMCIVVMAKGWFPHTLGQVPTHPWSGSVYYEHFCSLELEYRESQRIPISQAPL